MITKKTNEAALDAAHLDVHDGVFQGQVMVGCEGVETLEQLSAEA
jgi:pentose-5-phosphate-3-epimerase